MPLKRALHKNETAEGHRIEYLDGREHIVIPVVAAVEGVLNGYLLTMENVSKSLPAWEGVAVTMTHPQENGVGVSANTKEAIEKYCVGRFFNAHIDGNKFKGEFWIDLEKLEQHGDKEDLLARIENNTVFDVSTAYFADIIEKVGEYNGKKFEGIQVNLIPNHVAILLHEDGACNIKDGCGAPRTNQQEDAPVDEKVTTFLNKLKDMFGFSFKDGVAAILSSNKVGFSSLRRALEDEIRANERDDTFIYVVEVYDDEVVYGRETFNGDVDLQARTYSIENEKTMEVNLGDPYGVRQVVSFEPVGNEADQDCNCKEDQDMDREQLITTLAENSEIPFNREQLTAMDDSGLKFLARNLESETPTEDPAPAPAPAPAEVQEEDEEETQEPAQNNAGLKPEVVEFLNALDAETLSAVVEGATTMATNQDKEKQKLVSALVANSRCQLSEANLRSMNLEMLQGLYRSFNTNFAGRGGPTAPMANADEGIAPPPAVLLAEPTQ